MSGNNTIIRQNWCQPYPKGPDLATRQKYYNFCLTCDGMVSGPNEGMDQQGQRPCVCDVSSTSCGLPPGEANCVCTPNEQDDFNDGTSSVSKNDICVVLQESLTNTGSSGCPVGSWQFCQVDPDTGTRITDSCQARGFLCSNPDPGQCPSFSGDPSIGAPDVTPLSSTNFPDVNRNGNLSGVCGTDEIPTCGIQTYALLECDYDITKFTPTTANKWKQFDVSNASDLNIQNATANPWLCPAKSTDTQASFNSTACSNFNTISSYICGQSASSVGLTSCCATPDNNGDCQLNGLVQNCGADIGGYYDFCENVTPIINPDNTPVSPMQQQPQDINVLRWIIVGIGAFIIVLLFVGLIILAVKIV